MGSIGKGLFCASFPSPLPKPHPTAEADDENYSVEVALAKYAQSNTALKQLSNNTHAHKMIVYSNQVSFTVFLWPHAISLKLVFWILHFTSS